MKSKPNNVRHIAIYESELCVLAGLSAEGGDVEVAGSLYGLRTRDGTVVILLATSDGSGPTADGPGAIHSGGYCEIGVDYFRKVTSLVEHEFCVEWVGNFHSHHYLDINRPSGGDTREVVSLSRKNNFDEWISIVTTACGGRHNRSHRPAGPRPIANRQQVGVIRTNAFLYDAPQAGQFSRAGLRVIPEISPLRLAILAGGQLGIIDIGEHARWFPMARIRYDEADPNEMLPGRPTPGLDSLSEQIRRIPEAARDRIEISTGPGTVTLNVPLPAGATGRIIVDEEPPHLVRWAGLKGDRNGDSDVVDMIPVGDGDLLLERAYAMLASQAQLNGTNDIPPDRSDPRDVRPAFDVGRWLDAVRATRGGVCRVAKRLVRGLRSRRTGAGPGRCDDVDLGDRHEWEADDD